MKRIIFLFLLILGINNISAQTQKPEPTVFDSIPHPFQLYDYTKDGYAFYHLLKMYEPIYLHSKKYKRSYFEVLATASTLIGDYRKAHILFDKKNNVNKKEALTPSELDDYQMVSAKKAITSLADNHQAIFLNEAHHVPQHRAFVMQILQPLYDKGFRYFAVETLMESDDLLNERKFPTNGSGKYTREVVCADMVRYALEIGYTLVPYEKEGVKTSKEREKGQAQNLKERIFDSNPDAKLLLLAGYAHIKEDSSQYYVPMAYYFKQITGIDPFTITQEFFREYSTPEFELPLYRYAVSQFDLQKPSMFLDEQGHPWSYLYGDATIFHPRTEYIEGRADWLYEGIRSRKPYHIEKEKLDGITTPFFIKAYHKKEYPSGIPFDQIEIVDIDKPLPLLLQQGEYVIEVIQAKKQIKVASFEIVAD